MRNVGTLLVIAVLVIVVLAITGCTSEEDRQMDRQERAEQIAVEARAHMDALALEVGTEPEVTQDVLTACIPGQDDSGLELIYNIAIQIEPGAMDRLLREVAPRYRADGWRVRQRGDDDVVFERDTIIMGVLVADDVGRATVGGTGGCVR